MNPASPLTRFFELARTRGDRPCVQDELGIHAAADVARRASNVACALGGSLGGERVAILVRPGALFVEAFFGVLAAGGTVVVLSPQHPGPETTYFCEDAEVSRIVVSADLAERAREACHGTARRVVAIEDAGAYASKDHAPAPATPRGDDPALQLYTSGTTGKPKGAVLTHANLAVQQQLLRAAWGWSEADVLLHALPLHHLHGLGIALLTALGAGASARMLPVFDAAALWESMATSTVFMGVPTMYAKLFAAYDAAAPEIQARWAAGARSLRLATSGSAALPVTVGERWRAITGRYPLERFGMTEIGVGLTNPLDEDPEDARGGRRPGAVGRPLPTVETRIVNEAGEDVPDGTSGELWIRGPSVFSGYFRREAATRDAFRDGWFKTGDTVSRDASGYVKILGRTSVDILKSGGYKLSALEIEEVLREHPSVAEVAVVGVPDVTWGERVVACVVPRDGHACDEALLRAFAKERLAPYKVPKTVLTVTELPRNTMGKVVKPQLMRDIAARVGIGTGE